MRMKMRITWLSTISKMTAAAFVVFIDIASCKPPVVVAPVEPDTGGTCEDWCAHAYELRCEATKATEGGGSCTDVCHNLQTSGFAHFNLGCRRKATSCAAAEECEKNQ